MSSRFTTASNEGAAARLASRASRLAWISLRSSMRNGSPHELPIIDWAETIWSRVFPALHFHRYVLIRSGHSPPGIEPNDLLKPAPVAANRARILVYETRSADR